MQHVKIGVAIEIYCILDACCHSFFALKFFFSFALRCYSLKKKLDIDSVFSNSSLYNPLNPCQMIILGPCI